MSASIDEELKKEKTMVQKVEVLRVLQQYLMCGVRDYNKSVVAEAASKAEEIIKSIKFDK
jgi:hypothetical protein